MNRALEELIVKVGAGEPAGVYLVAGDLVLAEPAAERLARALAARAGCAVTSARRPLRLTPLLEDLRTYSLFEPGKVVLALDTAALADRAAAAELVDEVDEALPLGGPELGARERQAASRFLQVLRLFGVDPLAGTPAAAVADLPAWALQGGAARRKGRKARPKAEVEELRGHLTALLEAARAADIHGFAEGDLAELGAVVRDGLPRGHALVLAESSASPEHPLVEALRARGTFVEVGKVAAERGGGWQGLDLLAAELERQTGVEIAPEALAELARRTLRGADDRRGEGVDADSTLRFAGEYRKLADLVAGMGGAGGGAIERELVEETVVDRGQEDVWQLLDAMAAGRGGEALDRLRRYLAAAEEPVAARLALFSLLAGFSRQLTAVGGLLQMGAAAAGEANYSRFKDRVAPALQRELPGGRRNPLGGLHPFRLHRVYLAAGRLPAAQLARLPWRVLETELRLKGESGEPEAALSALVATLAGPPHAARAARSAR